MIDRLLQKLESPRRHLTLLVGLLALVFVLTAVVAWRASEADQARVEMASSAIEEAASLTLGDWSRLYGDYVASILSDVGPPVANNSATSDSLFRRIRTTDICQRCRAEGAVSAAFVIDVASARVQTSGTSVHSAVIDTVRARILSGQSAKFHPGIRGGLHFIELDGSITSVLALVATDSAGAPLRISALVITEALTRELIEYAFDNARTLPSAFAPDVPVEEVFTRTASVNGVAFMGEHLDTHVEAMVVASPVFGLSLGLRPSSTATSLFEFGATGTAERTTILLIMVVISALLITALLQIRREADMMRLRADFVSSVSHELRTPLAQIRMFTETLLLGRVRSDVERRRSLEIIDQEARRLAYLVENVLLFSKTEGGRESRVAREPTHFAEEIRHAVDALALLCRSRSADVRAELQENITVEVDRMALRQILVNLIDNALKYGPVGQRITVGAALFDDQARVWVDDEGPGIPAEDRARVFDSFYRLPRETESRVSGSGIGLAVVRELARLHGGDAWAESAPGRGARIVVQFPDAYLRSEDKGDFAAAS